MGVTVSSGAQQALKPSLSPASDYADFYQQLALFLRDKAPAPVPLADAILGLELIELALQSSREQRTIILS